MEPDIKFPVFHVKGQKALVTGASRGIGRALAAEWAPKGIRVNAIAPGYFRTAMTEVFFQNERWAAGMKAKIPLGRFGHVQDLIGATVFLCNPAAE